MKSLAGSVEQKKNEPGRAETAGDVNRKNKESVFITRNNCP
jgi:hypothetical protein